jgi:hypothetical protein
MPRSPAGHHDAIRRISISTVAFLAAAACSPGGSLPPSGDAPDSAMRSAASGEWEILFDGSGLESWRGFRRDDVPAAWSVQDGMLAFTPIDDDGQRGDIMTRDVYGDFELELEWRIAEGGNSGIMYRVTEDERATWLSGLEMQVLDDARHSDGRIPSHRAGALYDLVVPPEGITEPVGEWNDARIEVRNNRIRHWLNGHLTADVEIGSDDWNARLAASKFADVPSFAAASEGHIALQDHGDPVWYRDIRVRRLD